MKAAGNDFRKKNCSHLEKWLKDFSFKKTQHTEQSKSAISQTGKIKALCKYLETKGLHQTLPGKLGCDFLEKHLDKLRSKLTPKVEGDSDEQLRNINT